MGFKCAPLGIGTDIGGSIRSPAAFCNAYGFRPTARRNPCTGLKVPGPGEEAILGVVGPLASQSIEDLDLFQRAVIDQEPWDQETGLVPVPWKRVQPNKQMTVAIMWDDGYASFHCSIKKETKKKKTEKCNNNYNCSVVRPHPPITRALQHAKSKLQAAGIKVIDWKPYKHAYGWDIIVRSLPPPHLSPPIIHTKPPPSHPHQSAMYFPDAASSQRDLLATSGEPALPLTEWAFHYSRPTPLTISETWKLNVQRDTYRDEYHALMKTRNVDFILSPAYVGVAAVMGESHYWNYTAVWNILDQPAVVFPSGLFVDPALDSVDAAYQPRCEVDAREWAKYAPERYEGAPVGLQLTGKHFKDEETLAAAALVKGVLDGKKV